ncbi:hypothetical protein HK097_002334 [Rhizophlyctis rosea]|uniref:Tetratricopeptide repeat protein n=1 Tax=Rhizophlyctis rosea TaxID=64517 RepID=A0AAD5SMI5_9FUNG|nr:hypothetical protein HK097_002334 [Rhizophlyctis rosea]
MDKFALLLKKGKYLHELRNLVASLIDFAPAAPETLTSIAHAYLAGAFTYGREANRPADVENQPMEREDGNLKLAVARAWDLTAQARCPFSDEAGLHADMLDQALHSYPKHTEALRLRAELFMQNEDASRACEIYEQILLGNDGDLNANEGKIYALMELDRDAAAWAHAEYMTKMFPDNARVLALYAALRSKKRDDDANEDRAQEDFEKAMKCDKRCVQAVLGLSAIKGRDSHDDEIKFLKDYIMETSAPPAVYHRLADLQQDKGEPYEAEKNLRTALRAKGCNLREVDVKVEKWRKEHYPDSGDDASDGFGDPDIEGENV